MPVAQWAPWVSVFLGGCLSGAALLSLSTDRAPESKTVTAPPPRLATPAEPADEHPDETLDEGAPEANPDRAADTSESEPPEPAADETGPSAADVLTELERAYQLQMAAAAAVSPAPEAALADPVAADVQSERVPPEVNAPTPPTSSPEPVSEVPEAAPPDRRVALAEDEDEPRSRDVDPEQSRRPDDLDQAQLQQVAVIYQPVYVLPTGVATGQPASQAPASRPIGLDPWTGVSLGMQHNPWLTTPPSGGAWATIGISGGSWSAGFISRP